MGHHWPAHPVDPAALPGRAPVLLTGASPGLSVCVNWCWSSNLVLALVAI